MPEIQTLTGFKSVEHVVNFVKKETYEPFLLYIINKSKFFGEENELELIREQSNKENDFISRKTGQTYEATLLLNDVIIPEILKTKEKYFDSDNFRKWVNIEIKETIKDRLNGKIDDKNIILFNPFPFMFNRIENGICSIIARDNAEMYINEIEQENQELIRNKNIYLISFTFEEKIYIRKMKGDICTRDSRMNVKYVDDYDRDSFPFKCIIEEVKK